MKVRVILVVLLMSLGLNACVFAQDEKPVAAQASPDEKSSAAPSLANIMSELNRLRDEVLRLQQTLDMYMDTIVTDLRNENERLRREVRELSAEKGRTLPPVPMPDRELLEGLYESKKPSSSAAEGDDMAAEKAPENAPEVSAGGAPKLGLGVAQPDFETISEWGRTPEEAAAAPTSPDAPKASSLKGMICVVPAGTGDEALVALGRRLRMQFEACDNINIEVFDDKDAANAFKDHTEPSSASPSEHRVLCVSKHRASGRDLILLVRGGKIQEAPLTE